MPDPKCACRFARSCQVILLIAAVGVSGCAGERQPRPSPKQPLASQSAAIRFVGDESFIQSRFTRNVRYRDYEALTFPGGFLSYDKAHPGYGLTASVQQQYEIIEEFRAFKPARRLGLSISEQDVRTGRNRYGAYAFAAKENGRGACVRTLQFFGPAAKPGSPGNQRVRLGACRETGPGIRQWLEAFARDLMHRVRFANGATDGTNARVGR